MLKREEEMVFLDKCLDIEGIRDRSIISIKYIGARNFSIAESFENTAF